MAAAIAGISGGAVVGAGLIVNIPNPWAAVLKAACGTIGAANLKNWLGWVKSAYGRNPSLNNGTCYRTNLILKTRLTAVRAQGNCY